MRDAMCGLGAVIADSATRLGGFDLAAMERALMTRGPDGGGIWQDGGVGLVHRRLSIIDLAGGTQPMRSAAGTLIVFNGEIYNYRELRAELPDYPFRTRSDTEVVLALYERFGPAGFRRLRGMYAVVIHEPSSGRTVAARDPFGIKPLVWQRAAGALLVASEAKALHAATGAARTPDPDGLAELIDRHFVGGGRSALAGVASLRPGEVVRLEPSGPVQLTRVRPLASRPSAPSEATGAAFGRTLAESVDLHCRADVPVALFFSGGIDSSCLFHLLEQVGRPRLNTYTVAFADGTGAADAEIARDLAEARGCRHRTLGFDADDFWRILPQAARYMDDPTTDYAILPTWKLAEAASREVKVVLSGEGGDEVFAGYGRYRRRAKQTLRALRARVAPKRPSRGLLRRPDDWSAGRDDAAAAVDDPRGLTWLQRQQARDIGGWLPDDLLRKLDLCLMAHGLEGRVPFTDAAVANYGFHLPDRAKVRDNVGKHLVKTWLAEALPQARPFRRKQGFSVPVGRWLAPHADTLAELLPDQPLLHETMHPEAVRAAAQRPGRDGFLVWSLLFLAVWAQGEAAAGINGRTELFDALRDWAGRG